MLNVRKKIIKKWYDQSKLRLSEEFKTGLQFALLSKDYEQCCPFVYCRDFLQDAVQGHIQNIKRRIYAFYYDPEVDLPIYTKKLRLIFTNSKDGELYNKIPNCLDFIHQIEDRINIRQKTKIYECDNPPKKYEKSGVWLLEANRRWLASPPMLSMYTLMIRIGFVHKKDTFFEDTIDGLLKGNINPYQNVDKARLKRAKSGIDKILRLGDKKIFHKTMKLNYPNINVTTMHEQFGIVGFGDNLTKTHMPHWHRES